jgi:hypothetical protein
MGATNVRFGRKAVFLSLLFLGVLSGTGSALRAQSSTGEIRLTVKDPSDAAVQASGTLRNLAGGSPQPFQTDASGMYTATNLAQGRYRLEVSKSGFRTLITQIDVLAAPIVRTITLEISSQASSLEVVSVSPVPGSTMSKDDVPMNIQTADAKDISNTGAVDLSDFMNRRLGSVYMNNNQANPFQPDLNYRGYTASPL